MRQMWFGGFLILLLGLGYIGWLVLHGPTAAHTPTTLAGGEMSLRPLTPSGDLVLRLHGSNTIGAQLAPMLAEAFLKAQGATNISVKSMGMDELAVTGLLSGQRRVIEIKEHGSATAFLDLISGECDVGLASRKIQPSEVTDLAALGDMTSPASEHVAGLDGLAVIINPRNAISKISKHDIARIFTREIKQWKDVGGSGGTINLYARDARSGTFETFKSLVLEGKPISTKAVRFADGGELSKKVSQDPDAIGFIAFQYVLDAKPLAVFESGAKALLPTPLTVSTEDYLLSRRLYFYTASSPKNPFVRRFVDFALAKAGQEVVAASGFISLEVKAQPVSVVADDAPADYKRLTAGAERLSLNFRFRPGTAVLGNKALPDLDRVRSFVSTYDGADILLFGFADNAVNRDASCYSSKELAKAVSEQFSQRGLNPTTVEGFCSELPVASNDTVDGREKNRRVEIWVKKH